MKKVMTVTGIRPDFIRMSAVFAKLDEKFNHVLVHTGQHYDANLSDVFFKDLDIKQPDFNLGIGAAGKPHYVQSAELGIKLTELCLAEKPDLVVFLGDSNSVLAAIPLKKEGFKIAHIEAGMRSYDRRMLEETNRVACDHVSDMCFVYHDNYRLKLHDEGVGDSRIYVVGNTIVEPLLRIADTDYKPVARHILMDIHRPENFKYRDRMEKILHAARRYSEEFALPVKMLKFGRTMQAISDFGLSLDGIETIDLMGYKDFVRFQQESLFIISDSGSCQEEAPLLGKFVVVPRDYTERPESVWHDCSTMLALNDQYFEPKYRYSLELIKNNLPNFVGDVSWIGNGTASIQIVNKIEEMLRWDEA
jgi:UDP-N-acetylglucosamine 2-epimerase (non-hydrolysing)